MNIGIKKILTIAESSTPGINAWLVSELNDGDKVGQSSKFVSISNIYLLIKQAK